MARGEGRQETERQRVKGGAGGGERAGGKDESESEVEA